MVHIKRNRLAQTLFSGKIHLSVECNTWQCEFQIPFQINPICYPQWLTFTKPSCYVMCRDDQHEMLSVSRVTIILFPKFNSTLWRQEWGGEQWAAATHSNIRSHYVPLNDHLRCRNTQSGRNINTLLIKLFFGEFGSTRHNPAECNISDIKFVRHITITHSWAAASTSQQHPPRNI